MSVTLLLWGGPCLDVVAEVRRSWILRFGGRGCCALAVVGAALWPSWVLRFGRRGCCEFGRRGCCEFGIIGDAVLWHDAQTLHPWNFLV